MRFAIVVLAAVMPVFSVGATREDVDTRAIEIYRSGLQSTVAEMQLDTDARRILTARDKDRVRNAWGSFLDYMLALDSIGAYHRQQKGAASSPSHTRRFSPSIGARSR